MKEKFIKICSAKPIPYKAVREELDAAMLDGLRIMVDTCREQTEHYMGVHFYDSPDGVASGQISTGGARPAEAIDRVVTQKLRLNPGW